MKRTVIAAVVAASAGLASAAIDGQNIAADAATNGLSLLAVQDTATGFGNSSGTQGSSGGSELNAAWGTISGGKLKLSITGNIEANFNKMWIFFDDGSAGLNTLPNGGLVDGGFGEINNLGTTFDAGFNASRGLRLEIGGGFAGVNQFDLNAASASSVWSGGGPGTLPVGPVGSGGVTLGWDNSNALGVDGSSAAAALSADTGWEFEIDLASFFGNAGLTSIKASIFITNGGGDFMSNQVLGGAGGAGNLGAAVNFANIAGDQFVTIVPTPGSLALVGLAGLAAGRRRGR